MIKIQINSVLGKLLFEYECEDNTIAKTVTKAVKSYTDLSYSDLSHADLSSTDLSYSDLSSANLRYADLSYADLRYADLSYANLRYADLSSANLRYADLSYADLRYADLSYADLRYATTDKRYIQIGCIGSAKRTTTYCFEDDIIWCGCFTGTLEEFEKACRETHKDNPQFLKEYTGAIDYIKSLKTL